MVFILVCISFNSFLTSLSIMDLNVNKSTDFLEPSMADGVLVTLPILGSGPEGNKVL